MMMDTLERDTGEILSRSNPQRRGHDWNAFANSGLVDNGRLPSAPMDREVLKKRLHDELLLQAQARLPITYARLAERIATSDAMDAVRNALERLMDDDADEDRPLLAAFAVKALEPGLPAPWFFRKAESIGLFTGDPVGVEAYAFHAREFYRAIRFHARPSHSGQGSGRALRPALSLLPCADRLRRTRC